MKIKKFKTAKAFFSFVNNYEGNLTIKDNKAFNNNKLIAIKNEKINIKINS